MRVLVTAPWLGGAGGTERALYSVLRVFDRDQVDLVVGSQVGGPWAKVAPSIRVYSPADWRWRGSANKGRYTSRILRYLLNPVRRRLLPKYELHIAFMGGPDLTASSRVDVRLLNPCGTEATHAHGKYHYVALEAPDNESLVAEGLRTVVLPPPLFPLAESAEPTPRVPPGFFLTVFNPWGPIKGADDLAIAADSAPLPIVWCHSNRTIEFTMGHRLARHPNIIHVDDPSPGEMRDLYERCVAYLSFSKSEGFGWAAADALQHSRAVVSRPVGVFSFPESRQAGVHLVGARWAFDWSVLASASKGTPDRDLAWMSPEAFRRRIETIVNENCRPGRDR